MVIVLSLPKRGSSSLLFVTKNNLYRRRSNKRVLCPGRMAVDKARPEVYHSPIPGGPYLDILGGVQTS